MNNTENKNTTDGKVINFEIETTESKPFEIPLIEDGVYPAKLYEMELQTNIADSKGGIYDQLLWKFDTEGIKVIGRSSIIISNLSKANKWIEAINGKMLKNGDKFTPDMVVGKECNIVVKHKEQTINNKKVQMPVVTDVLKLKNKK